VWFGAGVNHRAVNEPLKMLKTTHKPLRDERHAVTDQDSCTEAISVFNDQQARCRVCNRLRKYVVLQELDYDPAHAGEQVSRRWTTTKRSTLSPLSNDTADLPPFSTAPPRARFLGRPRNNSRFLTDDVSRWRKPTSRSRRIRIKVSLDNLFWLIVAPAFVATTHLHTSGPSSASSS